MLCELSLLLLVTTCLQLARPSELRAAVPTNVSPELQAHAVPREVGAEERGGLGAAADTSPTNVVIVNSPYLPSTVRSRLGYGDLQHTGGYSMACGWAITQYRAR